MLYEHQPRKNASKNDRFQVLQAPLRKSFDTPKLLWQQPRRFLRRVVDVVHVIVVVVVVVKNMTRRLLAVKRPADDEDTLRLHKIFLSEQVLVVG